MLALGFRREEVAHKLDGFGFLVPDVERRNVLGVIFSSTVFPGRAPAGHVLLTAFVGGVRHADLANADLNTLTARVLDDLRLLLGVRGEPTFRAFQSLAQGDPAVRAELRPIQGDHGRRRAEECRLGARRLLSRGRGRG